MIHIEIAKSWKEGTLKLRIGDVGGAVILINATVNEVIEAIRDEIQKEMKKHD